MSLNSLPKHPEFILIPPPIVPGIQDRNSNPPKLFSAANSDNDLSKTPLPAIMVFSFNSEILEKFLLNFITAPSNKSSLNKTLEPAPSTNNFSSFLYSFKNSIPSNFQFGDAVVSDKHANFFVNKGNATYKDMKKLIDFVKEKVKNKSGVNLDLEIILVE